VTVSINGFSNSGWDEIARQYEGRTVLVTGGRGYLGAALSQALSELECKLILLDRSPGPAWKPQPSRASVKLVQGDVTLRETWESILPEVDYVFHLAGLEYVHRSHFDPVADLQVTAASVLHLLEACRTNSFPVRIIFSSSANLFGIADSVPVNEDALDNPLTVWAVHKLMAERYFQVYFIEHGVQSVILRPVNIYGSTPRAELTTRVVLNRVIAKALAGEPLTLYANQDCLRDYLFIDDMIRAFLMAALNNSAFDGRFFVVGSGEQKSLGEVWRLIADRIESVTSRPVKVLVDNSVKLGPSEMRNFVADSTRARQAFGWKPQVKLKEGIDLTIRSLEAASRLPTVG
jgi:nucleoside-diphosphate-sugar epimerase